MTHEIPEHVMMKFEEFSPGPVENMVLYFSPGRVNLIGEHTDYNGGYVLPAALTMGVYLLYRGRTDGLVRFASMDFDGLIEADVKNLTYIEEDGFANYPKGVIQLLCQSTGLPFCGGDFLYYGTLPNGAGLSSSAAIELVTATAVNEQMDATISPVTLAELSQRAENQFVGVNCGIMDQFAVAMGKENQALSLNCKTLDYQMVPLDLGDYLVVITNTNKRRGLADSKYNERRQECEDALAILRTQVPELTCLADVTPELWETLSSVISNERLNRRARHIVNENHRAKAAADVLGQGNLHRFGEMMKQSHVSLRDDYEVTGPELDVLAESAWAVDGCIGSRMTGAGFGGCTVSLVLASRITEFIAEVGETYKKAIGLTPSFYVCEVGEGAQNISLEWAQK